LSNLKIMKNRRQLMNWKQNFKPYIFHRVVCQTMSKTGEKKDIYTLSECIKAVRLVMQAKKKRFYEYSRNIDLERPKYCKNTCLTSMTSIVLSNRQGTKYNCFVLCKSHCTYCLIKELRIDNSLPTLSIPRRHLRMSKSWSIIG
jgi:hypothetical protein